jgi:hypothetical protein
MRKKQIISLFIYTVIAIIGIFLMFTYKPNLNHDKKIKINNDYTRGDRNAAVSNK